MTGLRWLRWSASEAVLFLVFVFFSVFFLVFFSLTTVDHIGQTSRSDMLQTVLPYYDQEAPAWCLEDMPCWVGSRADGRTDEQLVAEVRCDIALGSWAYSDQESPAGVVVKKCEAGAP